MTANLLLLALGCFQPVAVIGDGHERPATGTDTAEPDQDGGGADTGSDGGAQDGGADTGPGDGGGADTGDGGADTGDTGGEPEPSGCEEPWGDLDSTFNGSYDGAFGEIPAGSWWSGYYYVTGTEGAICALTCEPSVLRFWLVLGDHIYSSDPSEGREPLPDRIEVNGELTYLYLFTEQALPEELAGTITCTAATSSGDWTFTADVHRAAG